MEVHVLILEVQRKRRFRLGYLYMPPVFDFWDRGSCERSSKRRQRRRHLLPKGGQSSRRGDEGMNVYGRGRTCSPADVHGFQVLYVRPKFFRQRRAETHRSSRLLIILTSVVYNARKRGADRASDYFKRTESIAGVKDMRFQALMPDILHWLGIKKIDRMLSMSEYVEHVPV